MIQILIGSFALSLLHAMIPNHWIPLVVIGKSERWSKGELLGTTLLVAFSHTASTILIGFFVGLIGYNLATLYKPVIRWVAPTILLILGILYLGREVGVHIHAHRELIKPPSIHRSKSALLLSLSVAMFFSPCIEIESYYFIAGSLGWSGILLVSMVYLVISVSCMLLLVNFGFIGIEKIKWHFLEHHEKRITGTILVLLGILAYFVKIV